MLLGGRAAPRIKEQAENPIPPMVDAPHVGSRVDKPEPEALLKRAERLMHFAEVIVERAGADEDYRLQLQAIDRVKSSLEISHAGSGHDWRRRFRDGR